MAEFSLGLTKTAVEGTLSLVKSAVEEEKRLRHTVQSDLVFITGEFEVMRSFLRVANRERTANDEVALTLVRQLRTLAFDVEDCVEFIVHLDKPAGWGWLRRLWQTVNCRAPPLPLDVAVAEIKQLKARVEDVSQRNTRYNQILHGPDNDNSKQPVTAMPLPYATTTTTYPSSAAFHNLRKAWKATGKWSSNICNLQQELLIASEGDHDLRVISVWGSSTSTGGGGADLGTASIFRKAYRDPKICENFKIRAWVKLTHPFNHDEFLKSLLAQFYASSSHQANNAGVDFYAWMKAEVIEADNLMKANNLMKQMSEQRYLLVLEDVLTVAEWDVIRMYLPDSKNGSRVLLSTPQLGIALVCTGEPYQVSELRNFSNDNQFLCAFSKNEKMPSDIGEFVRQLLQGHGVISVWGDDDDDKSKLVDILYRGIINGWLEEIEGVADNSDHLDMFYKGIRNRRRKFELRHSSWVDVPDPLDLKVFAQRLFLNFHSDDIRASEITEVGKKGEAGLIEWCRNFLSGEGRHYPYAVVINGLQSKDDWDQIEGTFLPSKANKAGCILVITEEKPMATHCVKDHTHLAFNAQDLKADPSISALIKKGCWHYAIRGKKGRLFYDRSKDAREWANKFKDVGGINFDEGKDEEEEGFPVFMVKGDGKTVKRVSVPVAAGDGIAWPRVGGNSEKVVLKHAYYGSLLFQQQQIGRRCSWVDLPHQVDRPWLGAPLNLRDFSWRLLLDFCSDDPQAKEELAVRLMEGTIDPIVKCREFLHSKKCLVVITGVWRFEDWNSIKHAFFSDEQHIQSIFIVASDDDNIYNTAKALPLGTQEQDRIHMEYRRIFSTRKRYQDAIQWVEPVVHGRKVSPIRFKVLIGKLVSVWGISGVGKSTLVRTVYYKEVLYSSGLESSYGFGPTEAFAWVDVPSPFNLTDFAWRLLLDFYSDDPQAKEAATVSMIEEGCQVPILECCKILRTGKCLVVIDGLRSKQDWDVIKDTFLAEPIQGTIVVVTNEEEVAMHCVENVKGRTINITGLEANAALSLFKKIASKDKGLTRQEKVLPKSIVAKCGGLPKVIAAIGEAFVMTKQRGRSRWMESLSDNFMCKLETDPEFHGLIPLFSWMKSYFDSCSDSIKPCIFYLSIFPPAEKKSIRRRRLLWRWIGEGYCRDTSDGTTYEENGEKSISELVKLSIIQESANNKVFCEINGFFHEYIISRRMEDNLVFALEKGCSLNSQCAGQHLIIRSTWDRSDEIVYKSIDFSRLRSLTVFGKWESFFVSINMRLLRVLDLEDATDVEDEHLEEIAKRLTRLKFLSLRGHRKITRLPSSMGGLRQLQTLDIRGTSIVTLPPFITKLQKLRYIRAGTTTEVWDWEGDIVAADDEEEEDRASSSTQEGDIVSADGEEEEEEDRASSSTQEGDIVSADGEEEEEDRASSSTQEGDIVSADGEEEEDRASSSTQEGDIVSADGEEEEPGSSLSSNNRSRTLVSSFFLSKLCRCGGGGHDNNNGRPPAAAGVTVPADIGNMSVLHTLGVVKVNAQCGNKAIFQELKKLTQLRKLGVSGINKGNIHEFCEAISGHAHLKSLSVELDKDDDLDDNIPEPPKAIKSLKLYGRVNKLLVWMKHLDNLQKLHLTIEKPEELRDPPKLPYIPLGHLRIRPIQGGELHIGPLWARFTGTVEIQCSSLLHIKFGDEDLYGWGVDLLKVHFSGGSRSSLQISELSNLSVLGEVWLKGYTDEHKKYMQRQIDGIELDGDQERPVLKLVRPRSS